MTSYRIAALAAASSANALMSLLTYLPEFDEEQSDDVRVAEGAWHASAQRRRCVRPPVDFGRKRRS